MMQTLLTPGQVKTGEPLPADSIATSHQHYGKREASALGLASHGYVSHPARKVEPADCKSEPVKDCKEVPTTVKRSVLSRVITVRVVVRSRSAANSLFTFSVTMRGTLKVGCTPRLE